MSQEYLVECVCGEKIAVRVGQAGQQVRCGCGREVGIPLLRELRKLPVAQPTADSSAAKVRGAKPSPASPAAFFAVLLTIVGILACVVVLYARSKIDTTWSPESQKDYDSALIDEMPADSIYDAWYAFRNQGLGEKNPTIYMINRETHATFGRVLIWMAGATFVSAVSAVVLIAQGKSKAP
jgi:hypothetical protein